MRKLRNEMVTVLYIQSFILILIILSSVASAILQFLDFTHTSKCREMFHSFTRAHLNLQALTS